MPVGALPVLISEVRNLIFIDCHYFKYSNPALNALNAIILLSIFEN
jgi:hypothetical protein